jgi:tRNA pseudouridine38-40 synthase
MMRIALKFAYDGRNFYGYARQPKLRTIEGEIIHKLKQKNYIKNPKGAIFRSASRTDKGVSAFGNVCSFDTNKEIDNILENLNKNSNEIIFYGKKIVKPDFYPRHAKLRIYRYYLKKLDVDLDKIIEILDVFTGAHDFTNFAKIEKGKNPVRTIENIEFSENKDFLILDFYAQTFLWHQIRAIISVLDKTGKNKLEKEKIKQALDNPEIHKSYGLADSKYLILKDIFYDFDFRLKKDYFGRIADLEKKIIHHF